MDPYVMLLDLGVSLTQSFLGSLKSSPKAADISQLLGVGQAFVDALLSHKNDVVTKAALESQRG